MKNMKRILTILLVVLTALSCVAMLASCNGTKPEVTESATESATESVTEKKTESETEHSHAFGEWVTEKEATCTEDGEEARVCACGEKETKPVAAKGHTEVIDNAIDSTCTETGLTEGKHCSVCGEVLVKQETIAVKEHVFGEWVLTKLACTEDGEETRACLVCGETEKRTVAERGHSYGEAPAYVKDADGNVCVDCTDCGYRKVLTADETRKAIYDSMPDFVQEVVAYGCPDADNADNYLKIFALMKEAGITATVSGEQGYGTIQLSDFLEACSEADFGVYIDLFGMDAAAMVEKLDLYAYGYDCVRGIYLKDEPVVTMFPGLAEAKRRILAEVEDSSGWLIGANLLPYGDPAYAEGDHGYGYESHGWYNTVMEYAELVQPDFICFDRYPWASTGDLTGTPNYYVANLLVAKKVADQFDLPLYTYLQTVAIGGERAPTETQFRCEANLSLACGADTFFLFTVFGGHGFSGFISDGGDELGDMYYYVQTVMQEINAMKGIYDLFDLDKVMAVNCDEYKTAMKTFSEAEEYLTDSYGMLASVTPEKGAKCFVGCMKDDEGREGFYIVNNDFTEEVAMDYELTFTQETTYQLWTMNGLAEMGTATSLKLSLLGGEGQFLILGGENIPLGTVEIAED